MWNDRIMGLDGAPFPLRYRPNIIGPSSVEATLDLTPRQMIETTAVHELGHAVGYLAAGCDVDEIEILMEEDDLRAFRHFEVPGLPGVPVHGSAVTKFTAPPGVDQWGLLVAAAAGERAVNRWLHEAGLWTQTRAVGVEILAATDRRWAVAQDPRVGFGPPAEIDYLVLHDAADRLLVGRWESLMAALPVLLAERRLEGAERVAGLLGA